MTQPAEPIQPLVEILQADANVAALVGGGVYGGEIPRGENIQMPEAAAVLTPAGGGLLGRAYSDWGDIRIDTTCYGSTLREAWLVHLAVRSALKQLRRTVHGGVLIHWARESAGGVAGRDPVTQWPSVLGSYQVLISEVTVS